MRTNLKLPALAIVVILVIAACSSGASSAAPSAAGGASAAPSSGGASTAPSAAASASEAPSAAAANPTPEPAKACAQSSDGNAMQMWERSGGNKGMVDILVCAWNAANPTKPINLSYIVHTEMVAKIAQGVASGDVPDLMGMDLIYAPQFENAGQLVDITDQSKDWPELADVSPGHKTVATFNNRLFGVPLYADVSALFYNKDLFKKAGLDPNKPPTSLAEIRSYADKITALGGGVSGYYLPGNCAGCNIFTVGPLMWASGATIEANKCGDEPLVGDGVKAVDQWARDMVAAKNVPEGARAETGATFAEQFGTGKLGMMGTGNFNIVLARDQMKDHPFDFGISLLPGTDAGKYASFIGGDLVVIPQGSKRVDDALAFMHYLLNDTQQVELYAKALNLPTRTDPKLTDNQYYKAEPLMGDVAKALAVGKTPYSLTFFEQINDPAGPWLQHLQKAYYTTDDLDKVIADGKAAMKAISCK
ncbi:MAG: ABC transporter substrate-binding protein [Chloroflexota bacterium]